MLQEQPLHFVTASPESFTLLSPYITPLDKAAIEDDLRTEYSNYRNLQKQTHLCARVRDRVSRLCGQTLALGRELWAEIIPGHLRGQRSSRSLRLTEASTGKDKAFFEEYSKKKARFFLILFDDTCHEEEMQEAYERSSFVVMEGRGIRAAELQRQINCNHWRIHNLGHFKKYVILFFKLDLFGNLLNFGHLSKQLLDGNKEDEHFLQNFKGQLVDTYQRYELLEKEFVSSYLEKEDRIAFE